MVILWRAYQDELCGSPARVAYNVIWLVSTNFRVCPLRTIKHYPIHTCMHMYDVSLSRGRACAPRFSAHICISRSHKRPISYLKGLHCRTSCGGGVCVCMSVHVFLQYLPGHVLHLNWLWTTNSLLERVACQNHVAKPLIWALVVFVVLIYKSVGTV